MVAEAYFIVRTIAMPPSAHFPDGRGTVIEAIAVTPW
jgi:hypothetical protein